MGLNMASNENLGRVANALEMLVAHETGADGAEFNPTEAQQIVRHGMGEATYPVGTSIKVQHATYGALEFVVIGHDHDRDAHGHLEHSMTLQLVDCLSDGTPFDNPEALFVAKTVLPAGNYYIQLPDNYETTYAPESNYQFTTPVDVPVGGQIMLSWGYQKNISEARLSIYASWDATTALASGIRLTAGTTGTKLGKFDARDEETGINHIGIARYGDNRYSTSNVRQWLNSDSASDWFEPQSIFEHVCTYASRPGFLYGLPEAFRAALGEVRHTTLKNTPTYGGGGEETVDKAFLISRPEVGFDKESSLVDEGEPYEYWEGAAQEDHIKTRVGAPSTWWLRSPYATSVNYARTVYTSGALNSNIASTAHGVAPACTIM